MSFIAERSDPSGSMNDRCPSWPRHLVEVRGTDGCCPCAEPAARPAQLTRFARRRVKDCEDAFKMMSGFDVGDRRSRIRDLRHASTQNAFVSGESKMTQSLRRGPIFALPFGCRHYEEPSYRRRWRRAARATGDHDGEGSHRRRAQEARGLRKNKAGKTSSARGRGKKQDRRDRRQVAERSCAGRRKRLGQKTSGQAKDASQVGANGSDGANCPRQDICASRRRSANRASRE